jgi:transcriptional regulator with XRE-family HTH domain
VTRSRSSRTDDRQLSILRDILRDARIDAGLTQAELAQDLGAGQSFVSKYESGERRLDVAEVRRIAIALNSSLPEVVSKLESLLSGAE